MDDESGESMELMEEMPLKELLSNFSADNRQFTPPDVPIRDWED